LFVHRFFELVGGYIVDGTMCPKRIVISSPNVNLFLRIIKRKETNAR
jgi:hypothetical protein